jgi:hypothetical protein
MAAHQVQGVAGEPHGRAGDDPAEIGLLHEGLDVDAPGDSVDVHPVDEPGHVDPVEQVVDVDPVEEVIDIDPVEQGIEVHPFQQAVQVDAGQQLLDVYAIHNGLHVGALHDLVHVEGPDHAGSHPVRDRLHQALCATCDRAQQATPRTLPGGRSAGVMFCRESRIVLGRHGNERYDWGQPLASPQQGDDARDFRWDRCLDGHRCRSSSMSYTYEVRIRGRLSRTLKGEFEQLGLSADVEPVETLLYGAVVDQAALYGLIRRLEALGLELVEVRRVPVAPSDR